MWIVVLILLGYLYLTWLYFVVSFCYFLLCQVIVQYLCMCVLLHSSVDLANGPALLSLHVNELNWMELYYLYTQEKIISRKNYYFNNYNIVNSVFRCDFLLSLFYMSLLVVCYLCAFLMCLFCLCNWPYVCHASTLIIQNWIRLFSQGCHRQYWKIKTSGILSAIWYGCGKAKKSKIVNNIYCVCVCVFVCVCVCVCTCAHACVNVCTNKTSWTTGKYKYVSLHYITFRRPPNTIW
jgi:hypothetical protein